MPIVTGAVGSARRSLETYQWSSAPSRFARTHAAATFPHGHWVDFGAANALPRSDVGVPNVLESLPRVIEAVRACAQAQGPRAALALFNEQMRHLPGRGAGLLGFLHFIDELRAEADRCEGYVRRPVVDGHVPRWPGLQRGDVILEVGSTPADALGPALPRALAESETARIWRGCEDRVVSLYRTPGRAVPPPPPPPPRSSLSPTAPEFVPPPPPPPPPSPADPTAAGRSGAQLRAAQATVPPRAAPGRAVAQTTVPPQAAPGRPIAPLLPASTGPRAAAGSGPGRGARSGAPAPTTSVGDGHGSPASSATTLASDGSGVDGLLGDAVLVGREGAAAAAAGLPAELEWTWDGDAPPAEPSPQETSLAAHSLGWLWRR